MKYQGGKGRTARRIMEVMLAESNARKWIEPFVGGAWVLEKAFESGRFESLYAGDSLEDVILLYQAVAWGWNPPSLISRELHESLKKSEPSALRALVGFGSSYGGTFFAGYCGDSINSHSKYTNSELAARAVLKQRPAFQATELRACDYADWSDIIDSDTLLYCDPPYAGTYKYRGVDDFDSAVFWAWCREQAQKGASVFVSEYTAPDFAEVVWQKTSKQTAARHANHTVTESLYRVWS